MVKAGTSQHGFTSPIQDPEGREESYNFLGSLLDKNLRVTTTDSRMFWGRFRCSDPDSNIVLQHTYEYRQPTQTRQTDTSHPHVTIVSPSLESMGLGEDENHDITQSLQAAAAAQASANTSDSDSGSGSGSGSGGKGKEKASGKDKAKKDEMISRYLGLVVIPGKFVAKIEEEQFASQVRGRKLTVVPPAAGSGSGSASA